MKYKQVFARKVEKETEGSGEAMEGWERGDLNPSGFKSLVVKTKHSFLLNWP